MYKLSPDAYDEALEQIKEAGAGILGGCCGTTPDHLAAAVEKIQ
ncbi:MAG: homocysteine S-methyltransferase family protein [Planctomycetota bacterium]